MLSATPRQRIGNGAAGGKREAAARVGHAPYFICMDANIDLNHSAFLVQMSRLGWSNVAEGYPDADAPTADGKTSIS